MTFKSSHRIFPFFFKLCRFDFPAQKIKEIRMSTNLKESRLLGREHRVGVRKFRVIPALSFPHNCWTLPVSRRAGWSHWRPSRPADRTAAADATRKAGEERTVFRRCCCTTETAAARRASTSSFPGWTRRTFDCSLHHLLPPRLLLLLLLPC